LGEPLVYKQTLFNLRTPNLIFPLIHHLDGDVRAVAFTLVAPDATRLFYNFIHLKGEDTDRADFHADDATLAIGFVPEDTQPWFHICDEIILKRFVIPSSIKPTQSNIDIRIILLLTLLCPPLINRGCMGNIPPLKIRRGQEGL
jgi:hypothetical protein